MVAAAQRAALGNSGRGVQRAWLCMEEEEEEEEEEEGQPTGGGAARDQRHGRANTGHKRARAEASMTTSEQENSSKCETHSLQSTKLPLFNSMELSNTVQKPTSLENI
jgi:hypothetical protein